MPARPTLLVLRALGLGDLLTGLPALRALAAFFPGHRRILVAPAPLTALALWSGAVDEVAAAGPLQALPVWLCGADTAVNLHGRGPQSHRILSAARPARMLAFRHPDVPATRRSPEWRQGEHEVRRWCRMLEERGIPADPSQLWLAVPPTLRNPAAEAATVVHPGAKSPARRWPPERFAAVAAAERASGRRVLLTGSDAEIGLCQAIARRARLPSSAVLAGRTDVAKLAGVVASAGRVVCGDTGVAHLATAVGAPSVVLFGPNPPSEWGPPSDPRHRVLWAGGDPPAQGGGLVDARLLRIQIDDVLAALESLPGPCSGRA